MLFLSFSVSSLNFPSCFFSGAAFVTFPFLTLFSGGRFLSRDVLTWPDLGLRSPSADGLIDDAVLAPSCDGWIFDADAALMPLLLLVLPLRAFSKPLSLSRPYWF